MLFQVNSCYANMTVDSLTMEEVIELNEIIVGIQEFERKTHCGLFDSTIPAYSL
jgi:hypothetical protein